MKSPRARKRARGRKTPKILRRGIGPYFVRRHFVPGSENETSKRTKFFQRFVVMKVDMAVQRDCIGHSGPDKVLGAVAASVEGYVGTRRIDASNELEIAAQVERSRGGQPFINETRGTVISIDDTVPAQIAGAADEEPQRCPGGDLDRRGAAQREI